jgi:sensor domain CHASE-containing protein
MTISIAIILAAMIAATAASAHLWLRSRRLTRELASATGTVDELAALLALEHDTNYRMACKMYGKAAVDRVIEKAHSKGVC